MHGTELVADDLLRHRPARVNSEKLRSASRAAIARDVTVRLAARVERRSRCAKTRLAEIAQLTYFDRAETLLATCVNVQLERSNSIACLQ